MSLSNLTGKNARGAALRGLLLGLVLQALLIGSIEIAGQPVQGQAAGVFGPASAQSGEIGTLAQTRP